MAISTPRPWLASYADGVPDDIDPFEGSLYDLVRGSVEQYGEFKILNANFADYQLPRFRDAPQLETVLLNRPDLASEGAGETPIIGIAPAVGNAIFAATGVRLRSMPMIPDGLEIK